LGTFVWGTGDDLTFYHGGRTEGAAAEVMYNSARGQGAAVMVNGDAGAYLSSSLLRAVGREYGWGGSEGQPIDFGPIPSDALREAIGTYTTQYPLHAELRLRSEDGSLIIECFKLAIRSRAVLVAKDQLITVEEALPVKLERSDDGRTRSVDVGGWMFTRQDDAMDAAQEQ
jgi:hypothetical protein